MDKLYTGQEKGKEGEANCGDGLRTASSPETWAHPSLAHPTWPTLLRRHLCNHLIRLAPWGSRCPTLPTPTNTLKRLSNSLLLVTHRMLPEESLVNMTFSSPM